MILKKLDFQKIPELLLQVSEEIILPRHKKLGSIDISEKGYGELVTIADTETEKWLSNELKNLLPDSAFIGEEDTFINEKSFKVLVALIYKKEVVAGWIYEPINRTLAQAELGSGVFIGAKRINLNEYKQTNSFTGIAPQKLFDKASVNKSHIKKVYKPNCAGHEYIQLLNGQRHFTAYTRLRPWDHAAGVFMVNQAGGCSTLLDGRDYNVTISIGNLLSTYNKSSWDIMRSILI